MTTVFVWTVGDVVGLCLAALMIVVFGGFWLTIQVLEWWEDRKIAKRKAQR